MTKWQTALQFDLYGLSLIFLYLLGLILLAFICRKFNKGDTPEKFFLANRGLGFMVMVFTLYATQYSANTMLGFSGRAYRVGFSWLLVIQFFIFVTIFYMLYVPKLFTLAKNHRFITPNDFLLFRFQSKPLVLISSLIMLIAMCNFLTAQLMAMGRLLEGIAGPRYQHIDLYVYGAIGLAFIMVLYESIGGMLAVVWTDLIQGIILLIGFAILLAMTLHLYGGISTASEILQSQGTVGLSKLHVPDALGTREWISFVLLMSLGAALYPQAIQRVYAAKSKKTLLNSFGLMLFFPFFSALIAIVVGLIGAAHFPGLQGADADSIVPILMSQIMQSSAFGYWTMVILFAGILAAMMSTADSLLLSIVSIITIDIMKGFIHPEAQDKQLAIFGKLISWIIMGVLVAMAILLRDTTLVNLLERKFDILVQLAPAFILGINCPSLTTKSVLYGLLAGLCATLLLTYGVSGKIMGFHAGLYGLGINVLVMLIYHNISKKSVISA